MCFAFPASAYTFLLNTFNSNDIFKWIAWLIKRIAQTRSFIQGVPSHHTYIYILLRHEEWLYHKTGCRSRVFHSYLLVEAVCCRQCKLPARGLRMCFHMEISNPTNRRLEIECVCVVHIYDACLLHSNVPFIIMYIDLANELLVTVQISTSDRHKCIAKLSVFGYVDLVQKYKWRFDSVG